MYDRTITARAVEQRSREQGWQLQYHTRAQIDHAIDYLDALCDRDRGRLIRPLKPDEQRFIDNERILCALDYRYWSTFYAMIVNWQKKPQYFVPNVAQQIILELWAES